MPKSSRKTSSSASAKLEHRREAGAEWRRQVPFDALAAWKAPGDRDPVKIVIDQGGSRIPELLPVRYARMGNDPFSFLRGTAAVMAADLGALPATGLESSLVAIAISPISARTRWQRVRQSLTSTISTRPCRRRSNGI